MPTTTNSLPSRLDGLRLIAAAALAELDKTHSAAASVPDTATRTVSDIRPIFANEAATSQETPSRSSMSMLISAVPSNRKKKFPMQLHALLADPSVHDAISWLPHGRSFVVIRPEVLSTRVLPMYFAPEGSVKASKHKDRAMGKYPSFRQKLNCWGFRQVTHGADRGAFYHMLFLRDDPEACCDMVCQKSVKSDSKSVSSASTMSVSSGERRYSSAAVTVSTVGSLPVKKRHTIASASTDVPPNVEVKSKEKKKASNNLVHSSVFIEECDGFSDASKESEPSPRASSCKTTLTAEEAKTILARHFHEQQRAHILASLMENSQRAMISRGMEVEPTDSTRSHYSLPVSIENHVSGVATPPSNSQQLQESLGATMNAAVFAPTVHIAPPPSIFAAQAQHMAAVEAAKRALLDAYKKALLSL